MPLSFAGVKVEITVVTSGPLLYFRSQGPFLRVDGNVNVSAYRVAFTPYFDKLICSWRSFEKNPEFTPYFEIIIICSWHCAWCLCVFQQQKIPHRLTPVGQPHSGFGGLYVCMQYFRVTVPPAVMPILLRQIDMGSLTWTHMLHTKGGSGTNLSAQELTQRDRNTVPLTLLRQRIGPTVF